MKDIPIKYQWILPTALWLSFIWFFTFMGILWRRQRDACPSPDSQVMEAIQEIQQWQQYLIDKLNNE